MENNKNETIKFKFDYKEKDMENRLEAVIDYLSKELGFDEYTTIENSGLTEQYIEALGNYILYADNKDRVKANTSTINNNQYRVLCDKTRGINTHVNVKWREKLYGIKSDDKHDDYYRRMFKQLEDLFNIIDNINAYNELLSKDLSHKQKESIYDDKADCKQGLIFSEVRTKNEACRIRDEYKNADIEYTKENVKNILRCITEFKNATPFTTLHCVYMDIECAIKKAKLTDKQVIAVNDYMNGIDTALIDLTNLDYAIIKIIKKLS